MSRKELIKRYGLFVVSLFFMGLGVALTKHGELGVSPVSSVANVMSCKFTALSIGDWLIISNCTLLLGQILLLRKKFRLIQLLQIPLSFLLGYFTDLGMFLVSAIPNDAYLMRLALVACGIIALGFSITLGVAADVVLSSGEAFVKALADVFRKEFGSVKVVFDISWVLLAAVISLMLFDGQLIGVREGTLISALTLGFVVKFFTRRLKKPLTKVLEK